MSRLFRSIIIALLLSLALPLISSAHERWFVTSDHPPTDWGAIWSLPVGLAILSSFLVVGGLAWLQGIVGDPLWPRPALFQRLELAAPALLGVQTAIAMIYAATQMTLFVPNIELPRNVIGVTLAGIAVVSGFSFITGVLTRVGALATIGLLICAFALVPPEQVFEQILFVGISLYLVAVGRGVPRFDGSEEDRGPWSDRLLPHALTILRVSAGLTVLVLAFTEKLLNNALGVAFLQEYPNTNVPKSLGIEWFTDERFVAAAGIVEATAGAALLAGFLPRVVILALWIPFNLGIAFLPPEELIGHLPILATMYVLLVRGTEGVPPVPSDLRTSPAQRSAAERYAPQSGH